MRLALALLAALTFHAQAQSMRGFASANVPGVGTTCVWKIVTTQDPAAGQAASGPTINRTSPVVVNSDVGKPEYGYRVCFDDANTWPDGFNHVTVLLRDSTSGGESAATYEAFSKPGFLSPPKSLVVK